jgi:PAS domain S-box-containing protein
MTDAQGSHRKLTHEIVALRRKLARLEASRAQLKRMGKTLTESEERYRSLLKQSSDGVYLFDPKTAAVLEANAQFLKILNYAEEEITSLSLYDIVLVPRAQIDRSIQKVLRDRQQILAICQYRSRDGSIIDAETNSSVIRQDKARVIMVNVRNVTERKRAEQELQHQAKTLREQAELLDITDDAIMVRDLDDRIIFWNRGAENRYGWTAQDVPGKVSYVALQTQFPKPLDQIRADLVREGRWEGELIHTKSDGNILIVESHWALRRDKKGNPTAIMEINNDITKRKRAERALQSAKDELELRVVERTSELSAANERLLLELNRRRRVEEMLRKGAERYKNLFENSPMGIYRTNPEGRILMANPTMLRMLGYASFDEIAAFKARRADYEPTFLKRRFKGAP